MPPPVRVAGDVRPLDALLRHPGLRRASVSAAIVGAAGQRRRGAEAGQVDRPDLEALGERGRAPARRPASGCPMPCTGRAAPRCRGGRDDAGPLAGNPYRRARVRFVSHGERPPRRAEAAPGAGQAPPVDALRRMGAFEAGRRGPDHRARRGLLRLGRPRQPLPRRPQRAVLRATSATAAPTSPRPAPTRPASWASSRTGPTRTRARSSSRPSIAELAPGDLNRVVLHQRRQRGGRVGDQARPPVPQAHRQPEQDEDHRPRDRLPRHHAGRAGGDRHHRAARSRSSRSPRAAATCRTRTSTGCRPATAPRRSPRRSTQRIEFEGPDTVAAVILEPVQNAGGCFVAARGLLPARARDLRRVRRPADLRRGHLLVGPPRRVVRRAALRLPARHHHDGQGPHLAPTRRWARCIDLRPVAEPFLEGDELVHPRLHVRRPPDGLRGRAGQHRRLRAARASSRTCASTRPRFRGDARRRCATSRSSATCAARATSTRIELVKDQETKRALRAHEESEELLRGFLSAELFERGLICRADDRGDPVIQLSPPLIAGPEQFEEIEAVLRPVLEEAVAHGCCDG